MAQSDQPTSIGSTARKARPGGLLLIEVVAMLLILGGIAGYFIAHRPKYSDDPRLDRAARVLVAYLPRGPTPSKTPRLVSRPNGAGSQVVSSPEDLRKVAWIVPSTKALLRCPLWGIHPQAAVKRRQGAVVDVRSFRALRVQLQDTFGGDDDQTQVLICGLGFPWDLRSLPQADGMVFVFASSFPPVDTAVLDRCLSLAANAPGWREADQMLLEEEGLTKEQRLYVREELVQRALDDPFITSAACDHATALLRKHAGLDASGARDFLALLAMREVLDAPAEERPALIRAIHRAHPFLGNLLDYMPYSPQ